MSSLQDSPLVVVKYGGHSMSDDILNLAFAQNIVQAQEKGWRVLVGHGGGPQINSLLKRLDITGSFKNGLRITNPETMQVVEQVLCGEVNTWLVSLLCESNIKAVGLSGKDCKLLEAQPNKDEELQLVGEVTSVNSKLCYDLMQLNYVPVVAPVGYGPHGISLNINADTATGALAGALEADCFLLVTDVAGVLDAHKKRLPHLRRADVERLVQEEVIMGGMIPKTESCLHALEQGCKVAVIFNGSNIAELNILLDEISTGLKTGDFSQLSNGTVITV